MQTIVTELYEQFKTIEKNFFGLMAETSTEPQRDSVRHIYSDAWTNYNAAIVRQFNSNDARVKQAVEDLDANTTKIENALANLQNIAATINTIDQLVKVATEILTALP